MATIQELNAQKEQLAQQLATLERQIADAQKGQRQEAIARVKALMAEYGLTAADLAGRAPTAPKAEGGKKVAAKYRDPATGKTWTGTGKPPAWIAEAKNRSKFLIEPVAASQETASAAAKPKAPATKAVRGAKPATVKAAKVTKAPMATKVAARKGAGKKAAAKTLVDAASAMSSTVDAASTPAPTGG